jgi:virginiamycin B lyase
MSSGPRAAGVATSARSILRGLGVCLAAILAMPAAAAAIDEFSVAPGANPGGITQGPDGAMWFVEEGSSTIGRITTAGVVTNHFPVNVATPSPVPPTDPSYVNGLDQITRGPDGNLWFTQPRDDQIGVITPGGAVTEYNVSPPGSRPDAITLGPDNNLWFTAPGANLIGRIMTNGAISTFPGALSGAQDITAGPDGALWFTESGGNSIGRMSTGGVILNHFPVPTPGAEPTGITMAGGGLWFTESAVGQIAQISTSGTVTEYPGAGAAPSAIAGGADGALWFTQSLGNAIGRSTTAGAITNHFAVPTPGSEPSDIAAGPGGTLWFTEFAANKIGRIATAPPVVVTPPPVKPLLRKKCKVPKVKGLTVKKAVKKLKRAKCKYKVKGRGRVTKTSPKAGKRTRKTVKVTAKPKRRRSR